MKQPTMQQLLWLVPVLFAIHNLEEVRGMAKEPAKLSLPFHKGVTLPQFVIAVTILTSVAFGVTWLGVHYMSSGIGIYLVFVIQMIILVNAFLPHIALFIRYRSYNPGLLTAVIITLPFSVYLLRWVLENQFVTPRGAIIVLIAAPIAMTVFVVISLKLGEILYCRFGGRE